MLLLNLNISPFSTFHQLLHSFVLVKEYRMTICVNCNKNLSEVYTIYSSNDIRLELCVNLL